MAFIIYLLASILVLSVLLVSTIYNLISTIKMDKDFREINKRYLEYINKLLESEDK